MTWLYVSIVVMWVVLVWAIARVLDLGNQVHDLRGSLGSLDRSTTNRFAVVMASNKKLHAIHSGITNRLNKVVARLDKEGAGS